MYSGHASPQATLTFKYLCEFKGPRENDLLYTSFINSRTAVAGAIIGLLLVFYYSKNLNCIGALSFF